MEKNIVFTIHNYSGAQTYAEQMRSYLLEKEDINFYVIFFGHPQYQEFTVAKEEKAVLFYFPFPGKRKIEIYSKRVVDLLEPWFCHKSNLLLHLNSPYQYWFARHFRERFSAGIVFTVHYLLNKFTFFRLQGDMPDKVNDIAGTREIMDLADRIICVTDFARQVYENEWGNKLVRIYNGYGSLSGKTDCLDTDERNRLRQEMGLSADEVILLYAGRIDDSKGCDSLVEAMNSLIKKYRNIRLIIAGEGNYKLCLKKVGLNCSRILFTGYLCREKLEKLYRLADAGIVPSLWEQCSYVALEMMASRLPIIYADVPGLNELFREGEIGVKIKVLPEGKKYRLSIRPQDIELAVERFLMFTPAQRVALGMRAYYEWERFYRKEMMGEEVYKIYKEVLKN